MGETRKPKIMAPGHADDFQTPPEALEALYRHIPRHWTVWECAAGKGNLVRAFCERGNEVIATDILTGQDYLAWEPPSYWHCAVTNVPFSLKDQFLARAYSLGRPFAFLLPFAALEGQKRQALYRAHGLEVICLPARVKFTTPSGKVGGSWFASAWFTWGLQIGQALTFWEEPQEPSLQASFGFASAPAPPRAPHTQKEPQP